MANKIEVRFQPEKKLSKAGHEYTLVEMWITNRDGSWPDRATVSIMPFHARLLLQNLPEFLEQIKNAEQLKENPESEASSEPTPF
tara:strand:+ start:777 stop:1031 length:255 start_codon:yes stop_codon:yes gene_type:complete